MTVPSVSVRRTTAPLARRLWGQPLWAHVGALALLLLIALPFMTPRGSFTSDEGAYALQEQALAEGTWEYEYRAADIDPEGRYFPLNQSQELNGRYYPYVKHPAYPVLLRGATAVFGPTFGLNVLGLLGVVGTAVAAWLLAGQLDPRLCRAAFWLAASGPVLVNGYILWAHAPSAALAGLALFGAVRLVKALTTGHREGLAPCLAGVAGCLAAGVLLRAEGLLFAGALTLALAVVVAGRVGLRPAALIAGALAAPAVLAAVVEDRWVQAIVGGAHQSLAVRGETASFLAGRFRGAWHDLFQAHIVRSPADVAVFVGMGLVVGFGYRALRRWGATSRRDLVVAASAAAVLYLVRLRLEPTGLITGLFAAWPLVLLGLAVFPWRRAEPKAVTTFLGITGALFAVAVIATQYAEGGGAEWGGRFWSPLFVLLAVLATAGFDQRLRPAGAPDRRRVVTALAILGVTTAAVGLLSVGRLRMDQSRMVEAVARHPAPVTVSTFAGLPRMAWTTHERLSWLYADEGDLPGLLEALDRHGIREVSVVASGRAEDFDPGPYRVAEVVDEPDLRRFGMDLYVLRS
ncbi:MAG: hypothetical protein M3179_02190 [Actinomycetota bacterium]|nr:hypothetical protein [Actinomycetota bacterium]